MYRTAVIVLFFAGPALAHPEHVGGSPLRSGLVHLLGGPDHLALLLPPLVVLGGVGAMIRVLRRRAQHAKPKPSI